MEVMPVQLKSFGITNIGRVRNNNEDVWAILPQKRFFILADGMGGHKAGEVASSLTMESMNLSISTLSDSASIEEACRFLRNAIIKANAEVNHASHEHPEYAGMGTTLSCFIIVDDVLIYGHVGDSRLYRYRKKLEQLSEDHCLHRDEKKVSMRNVITRAIGTLPTILPDIGVIPLRQKDVYMLCSDGLSDYVDKKVISELLASPSPLEEIGKKLVESALEKGGNDNITLLLVKVL
jgi:PPM family protein phosphatase